MTRSLRTRVAQGFMSQVYARVVTIAIQVLFVPLLILNWGVATYGEWIVLTSVSSFLSFASFGYGTATASELSMAMGGDRAGQALETFQSALAVTTVVCVVFGALFYLFVELAPIDVWFNIRSIQLSTAKLILLLVGFKVFASFFFGLFFSALYAVGRYGYAQFLQSTFLLAEFAIIAVLVLQFDADPVPAALAGAAVSLVEILIAWIVAKRSMHWLRIGFGACRLATIKRLFVPAISYAFYSFGANAVLIQGPRLVISAMLGPSATAVYSVITTLARFLLQAVTSISLSVQVEISRCFGAGDLAMARKLHHRAAQLSLWIVAIGSVFLTVCGGWILEFWTGGKVAMDYPLFLVQLLIGVLSAVWYVSLTSLMATNKTQVAMVALLPASAVGLVLGAALIGPLGLSGMAVGLLFVEVVMLVVVTWRALRLLEASVTTFTKEMTRSPLILLVGEYQRFRRHVRTKPTQ